MRPSVCAGTRLSPPLPRGLSPQEGRQGIQGWSGEGKEEESG